MKKKTFPYFPVAGVIILGGTIAFLNGNNGQIASAPQGPPQEVPVQAEKGTERKTESKDSFAKSVASKTPPRQPGRPPSRPGEKDGETVSIALPKQVILKPTPNEASVSGQWYQEGALAKDQSR